MVISTTRRVKSESSMLSLPSCASARRRKPRPRASWLDQAASLSAIFSERTARDTQGGSSLCGSPSAKQTAASTHICPGMGWPTPEQRPASTVSRTLIAISRVICIYFSFARIGCDRQESNLQLWGSTPLRLPFRHWRKNKHERSSPIAQDKSNARRICTRHQALGRGCRAGGRRSPRCA